MQLSRRLATDSDLETLANLSRLSFAPLTSTQQIKEDWAGQPISPPGQSVFMAINEATGAIVGRYRQLDLEGWLAGNRVPMTGLGGVSVALEARGQGVAGWMMRQAIADAHEQAIPLMMLYPFQHGFYRRFGYAPMQPMPQYRVALRDVPRFPERSRLQPWRSDQKSALIALYNQVAPQQSGWLARTEWQWSDRLDFEAGQELYGYWEGDELLGYVAFDFVERGRVISLQEYVASTASAYRGILGFLSGLQDQVNTLIWTTHTADPFPYLLHEQCQEAALNSPDLKLHFGFIDPIGYVTCGFMWRLVNLPRAMQLRRIQPGPPFAIAFQVQDPVLGEQTIAVEGRDGQMQVIHLACPTTIRLSIEHLTQLFAGVRRATDLQWLGEMEVEGDRTQLTLLDNAWALPPLSCWDFF